MFALFLLGACVEQAPPTCEALAGLQADSCLADELEGLAATDLPLVREKAASIQDPIVRGAALDAWLQDHAQQVPREDAMGLCELLQDPARGACAKRVNAAHLNR